MEPKECFFAGISPVIAGWSMISGCFSAGEAGELPIGEPITVELADLALHHDEDDELH
jgi:hypothetical protein